MRAQTLTLTIVLLLVAGCVRRDEAPIREDGFADYAWSRDGRVLAISVVEGGESAVALVEGGIERRIPVMAGQGVEAGSLAWREDQLILAVSRQVERESKWNEGLALNSSIVAVNQDGGIVQLVGWGRFISAIGITDGDLAYVRAGDENRLFTQGSNAPVDPEIVLMRNGTSTVVASAYAIEGVTANDSGLFFSTFEELGDDPAHWKVAPDATIAEPFDRVTRFTQAEGYERHSSLCAVVGPVEGLTSALVRGTKDELWLFPDGGEPRFLADLPSFALVPCYNSATDEVMFMDLAGPVARLAKMRLADGVIEAVYRLPG